MVEIVKRTRTIKRTVKPKPLYRVRFVIDEGAEFEECNGARRPLTEEEYRGNEYQKNSRDVSYIEYRRYYGNPDRHVYLGCIVERQCSECGTWHQRASLWSIDFMDDSPELRAVNIDHNYSAEEAITLPGYLAEVAKEMITEAGNG